ncbi:MAG: hypothetical protein OXH76_08365 [Boseongicola sp.]|nr:hypothetical protein [Boseongicola sp.]
MPDDYIGDPTRGLLERIKTNVTSARKDINDTKNAGGPDALAVDPFGFPIERLNAAIADLNLLLGSDEEDTLPDGGGRRRARRRTR